MKTPTSRAEIIKVLKKSNLIYKRSYALECGRNKKLTEALKIQHNDTLDKCIKIVDKVKGIGFAGVDDMSMIYVKDLKQAIKKLRK